MQRIAYLVIFAGLTVLLSGCIYTNVETPGIVKTETQFQLTTEDFEVLERVSVSGETILWFGAVMSGGKGYQALLERAQEIGGDEVMNYSFDYMQKSVLLFIYSEFHWKATGLAVKLKNKIKS
ncbi:MAG: hypothetical protein GY786_17040 [Proteobacteria bacterium]|nr:hypothetical protein [Pseudomonadota bacterium]